MDTKDLQKQIKETFETHFGYTPLNERLTDVQNEFLELIKWQDIKNLREETSDILCSIIQLCNECEWDVETLINENKQKIEHRALQYKTLGRKTKVAIFGGAFNPITKAHIQTAQFVLNTSKEIDEVWLMPSYHHMYGKNLIDSQHRLEMCKLAAKVDGRIKVFDYEISNQLAGETYYLFKKLKMESDYNDKYNFSMIIGLDNANTFDKWVNFEELERMTRFIVVPRKGYTRDEKVNWYLNKPHIYLNCETNIIETSSTNIRDMLNEYYEGNTHIYTQICSFMNKEVLDYIISNNLYQKTC